MPKQRLTDRQLISGVTLTDLLHFVVTGDTSQSPAGSSYKGSVEQLFNGFSSYTCSTPLLLDTVNACTSAITINGNVIINGSATTINTEVIQSKDNNIVLNYSGTHLTAIGGGITLEDGQSTGVDSRIYTDSNGTWLFDPGLSASTGTIDTLSACTGVYTSNLYGCSPLHIEPSGLNDVYIVENGGNVGIGTTSPTEVLDVSGNTKISEDLFVGDTVYIGNVTGTPTTNASIYITQPSITGTSESPIIDIQVDDANSYFRIGNATASDGFFTPLIETRQSDSPDRLSLFFDALVEDTQDTPGAADVMRFRARRDTPDFIQNRDLFSWYNYTTRLMDLDKDGNLDIIQGGLRINTLGTGTSVNNLGIDSSGNVVTGTTGSVSDIFVTGGTFDNNTDTITFINTSGGTFDVTGVTDTFTGNTSGDCITDLYVANIHSCSPLNINPLDEGNVYFGSTSGVTIDVVNSRLGIGTTTPTEKLDVSGNTKISGSLNIGVILSGTPLINLGLDSSGNVVTGGTVNLSRRTTSVNAGTDPNVNNVEVVFYSATTGNGTITLNSEMNVAGKEVILIRTSTTNSAGISGSGGALINGSVNRPLPTTVYSKVNCISDGTNWFCSSQTVI